MSFISDSFRSLKLCKISVESTKRHDGWVYWEGQKKKKNEEYATDWSQIGKVVDITNNDVLFYWCDGSIDGLYRPLGKSHEGTDGHKKVAWIDKIPKSCV